MPSARILFGEDAQHGLFPWQVKLFGPEGCGGTLIRADVSNNLDDVFIILALGCIDRSTLLTERV